MEGSHSQVSEEELVLGLREDVTRFPVHVQEPMFSPTALALPLGQGTQLPPDMKLSPSHSGEREREGREGRERRGGRGGEGERGGEGRERGDGREYSIGKLRELVSVSITFHTTTFCTIDM